MPPGPVYLAAQSSIGKAVCWYLQDVMGFKLEAVLGFKLEAVLGFKLEAVSGQGHWEE